MQRDVYKRQGTRWLREVPKRCAPLRRYSDRHGVIASLVVGIPGVVGGEFLVAVSYTHLDVYKRQRYRSMVFLPIISI